MNRSSLTAAARFALGALYLTLVFVSTGCGEKGGDGGTAKVKVGFSQIGAESAWRTANSESIRGEAEKRGIELKFADAQQKQENQIKALKLFIAQGVDVIALAPVVETGFEPVLREIKKAGIPVILTDRSVDVADDSLFVTFIASDFVREGRLAAEWLTKAKDGKATIAELVGTPGSAPAIDRKKGFEEALRDHPEMRVVKSQSGDFTRAGGKQVMEAFLKSSEGASIDAVYAHNDDMALGAIQAIEEAGRQPGKDILVVSIDGVRDALVAIKEGKLACSVECSPMIGPILFDTVDAVLSKKPVEKRIVIEDRVFDASNVEAALPDRAY